MSGKNVLCEENEIVPGEQAVYMKETGKMEVKPIDVTLYTAWHVEIYFQERDLGRDDVLFVPMVWVKYRFIDEG